MSDSKKVLYLLLLFITLYIQDTDAKKRKITNQQHVKGSKGSKFSVVLILGNPHKPSESDEDCGGEVQGLNFQVQNRIQPCGTSSETEYRRTFLSSNSSPSKCEKLLRIKLLSLINWAHDTANLVTAIVSIASNKNNKTSGEATILSRNHLNYNFYNFESSKLGQAADNSKLVDIVQSDKDRLEKPKGDLNSETNKTKPEEPCDEDNKNKQTTNAQASPPSTGPESCGIPVNAILMPGQYDKNEEKNKTKSCESSTEQTHTSDEGCDQQEATSAKKSDSDESCGGNDEPKETSADEGCDNENENDESSESPDEAGCDNEGAEVNKKREIFNKFKFPSNVASNNKLDDDLPIIKSAPESSGSLPIKYAYPKPIKFNNINKYSRYANADNEVSVNEPNESDMFMNFLETVSRHKRDYEPFLNIFNILSSFHNSPLFSKRESSTSNSAGALNLKGTKRLVDSQRMKPCLLDVLKPTMKLIKKERSSFLLVIIGGDLSGIKSGKSEIGRTMKYIEKNSIKNRNTIVISEQCPKQCDDNDDEDSILPLYAKGYKSESFNNIQKQCDIPDAIRNLIECNMKN